MAAAFAGRCSHGKVLAGATLRTEHLEDIEEWRREGLIVSIEDPVRTEWCEPCLGRDIRRSDLQEPTPLLEKASDG